MLFVNRRMEKKNDSKGLVFEVMNGRWLAVLTEQLFIRESVNLRLIKERFNGCYFLDLDADIDKGFTIQSETW